MNMVLAFLGGMAVMYVVACIVTMMDEYWLDDKFCALFSAVGIVLLFIPCLLWGLLRHVVIPISVERQRDHYVQSIIRTSKEILPGLYLCHDPGARFIGNKFFLFRLKKIKNFQKNA